MSSNTNEDYDLEFDDSKNIPSYDWFSTFADIAYRETGWTKKDILEYNKIFEELSWTE